MTGPARRSALDPGARPGRFGRTAAAGIVLRERRPLEMVEIGLPAALAETCRRGLAERLGFLPPALNRAAGKELRAIALGPGHWLAVRAERRAGALLAELAASGAYVTDLGHARTVIRIAGRAWVDVLGKGCSLDFHPAAFPAHSAAQTLCADVAVVLDAVATDAIDIYVPRSYALHFWEWLTDAAFAGGYEVQPAAP